MIRRALGLGLAKQSGNEDCILPGTLDILPPTSRQYSTSLKGIYEALTFEPQDLHEI